MEKLEILGHPIRYEKSGLDLDLNGRKVKLDFAKDKTGKPMLVLADAEKGDVSAKISKADMQAVLLSVATLAAKQQGVTIQDLKVDLTSEGKRSVAAEARVKAKKLMMSGVVVIKGKLDVDDELNATVSGLSCTGEGMIGSLAAGMVGNKLKAYEGKRIPLMAFSLGNVTLRNLKIAVNGSLQVTAAFGSQK